MTDARRWCAGCGYAYRSLEEAAKARACPKCGGRVLARKRPAITATVERRETAVARDPERR